VGQGHQHAFAKGRALHGPHARSRLDINNNIINARTHAQTSVPPRPNGYPPPNIPRMARNVSLRKTSGNARNV
jgi:hypothetical protein